MSREIAQVSRPPFPLRFLKEAKKTFLFFSSAFAGSAVFFCGYLLYLLYFAKKRDLPIQTPIQAMVLSVYASLFFGLASTSVYIISSVALEERKLGDKNRGEVDPHSTEAQVSSVYKNA